LFAAALAGLAAGCTEEWSALKPPSELIKLDTWTNVPEDQHDVRGRVGDVLHLSLGKGMDRSQLGWLRVIVNTKGQECPEFDTSAEPICYVFRAAQPGQYRLEVRREIVAQTNPDDNPEAEPEPPRRLDRSWPPRVWNITITE
jgi:hypothetical protein